MDKPTSGEGAEAPAARPTLWSLRPAGEHAGLRRAAQDAGFGLRTLSLQRLLGRAADAGLDLALTAPIRVYTSPAAVRFARAGAARIGGEGLDVAVGSGTAAALRTAGAATVLAPERMDSEGLLALPELQSLSGVAIGLVTAPRGRGLLPQVLRDRGAELRIAEVYARVRLYGGARRLADFVDDEAGVLLASSAEALALLLARVPPADRRKGRMLRDRPLVASSARLAALAREAGFGDIVQAAGPSAPALVEAASTRAPYTRAAAAGRAHFD